MICGCMDIESILLMVAPFSYFIFGRNQHYQFNFCNIVWKWIMSKILFFFVFSCMHTHMHTDTHSPSLSHYHMHTTAHIAFVLNNVSVRARVRFFLACMRAHAAHTMIPSASSMLSTQRLFVPFYNKV